MKLKIKRIKYRTISSIAGPLTLPQIQDMLRYDKAFVNPDDITLVAFPTFGSSDGDFGGRVTLDRWRSFGVLVKEINDGHQAQLQDHWITFKGSELAMVTFGEFLNQK